VLDAADQRVGGHSLADSGIGCEALRGRAGDSGADHALTVALPRLPRRIEHHALPGPGLTDQHDHATVTGDRLECLPLLHAERIAAASFHCLNTSLTGTLAGDADTLVGALARGVERVLLKLAHRPGRPPAALELHELAGLLECCEVLARCSWSLRAGGELKYARLKFAGLDHRPLTRDVSEQLAAKVTLRLVGAVHEQLLCRVAGEAVFLTDRAPGRRHVYFRGHGLRASGRDGDRAELAGVRRAAVAVAKLAGGALDHLAAPRPTLHQLLRDAVQLEEPSVPAGPAADLESELA
jgi:hypothetical protein